MAGRHRRQKKRFIKKVGLPLAVIAGLAVVILLIFTALRQRQQIQQSQFNPLGEENYRQDFRTAEEVLAAFIARSGGDAVVGVKSMRFTGQLTNMNGTFAISVAKRAPNLSRTNVKSVTGQEFTRIWDGSSEWVNEGQQWEQRSAVAVESDNLMSITIRAALGQARAVLTGKTDIEGLECYAIEISHPQAGNFVSFIDVDSLLERRLDIIADNGERLMHFYYDHQEVDGIVTPKRAVIVDSSGTKSALEIGTMAFNPGLMLALFDPRADNN